MMMMMMMMMIRALGLTRGKNTFSGVVLTLTQNQLFRAGSHFDISISTSINISIRKIRKICVNWGYISISVSISIRKWKKFHSLCLCLCNPGSHILFLFFLYISHCVFNHTPNKKWSMRQEAISTLSL